MGFQDDKYDELSGYMNQLKVLAVELDDAEWGPSYWAVKDAIDSLEKARAALGEVE